MRKQHSETYEKQDEKQSKGEQQVKQNATHNYQERESSGEKQQSKLNKRRGRPKKNKKSEENEDYFIIQDQSKIRIQQRLNNQQKLNNGENTEYQNVETQEENQKERISINTEMNQYEKFTKQLNSDTVFRFSNNEHEGSENYVSTENLNDQQDQRQLQSKSTSDELELNYQYRCQFCGQFFLQHDQFQLHQTICSNQIQKIHKAIYQPQINQTETEEVGGFNCDQCQKKNFSQSGLKKHITRMHKQKKQNQQERRTRNRNQKKKIKNQTNTEQGNANSEENSYVVLEENLLNQHKKQISPININEINNTSKIKVSKKEKRMPKVTLSNSSDNLTENEESRENDEYQQKHHVEKEAQTQKKTSQHLNNNILQQDTLNEYIFKCIECPVVFSLKSQLAAHLEISHKKDLTEG